MPEGHTIHRLARDLNRDLRGNTIAAASPQGRFEAGAARIDGAHCDGFEAFGKHLIGRFDSGDVLHVHLGLIGKFRPTSGEPVGAVRLRLSPTSDQQGASDKQRHWDLRGPMTCAVGGADIADTVAESIGPDPLRRDGDVERFVEAMSRRRVSVGAALLDQKVIAGIGNVYRAELLFIAGINPRTPANRLDESDVRLLWKLAKEHLRVGVRLNRIVTVDPNDVGFPTVRSVPKGERLYVYKRQGAPCRTCGDSIEEFDVGARKMWECPSCQ